MAIFRGTGGSGNSTDDSIVDAVTEQAGIATTKASEAATSATNAASSASAASSSATTAATKATEATTAKTDAETAETNAQTAQSAAETARDQAQTSATSAATSANTANSAAVQTVAGSNTQVVGVYNNIGSVNTVAGDITNVNTVAGISSDVTTVAADASDIGTVSSNIGNVNNVGNNISNVNSVAGNASNINTVASDGTDIGTVAGNISNVNTVAGISSNVTTVAGLETKMDTVIADASDIGTVAGNINDVSTVAGISSDVTSVADNSSNINSVASNMTAVQGASTNATNAATSASNASDSASAASTSASTAATKATEAAASAALIANLTAATGPAGTNANYNSTTGVLTVPRGDTGATGPQGATGSISSSSSLTVDGTVTADGLNVNSGTTNTVATFTSTDAGAGILLTDPTGSSKVEASGANLRVSVDDDGAVANSAIQFRVDGGTKATIDSSGRLGIGTTAAEHALHIYDAGSNNAGTMKIGGSASSLGLEIAYSQAGNTSGSIYANPTYTNDGAVLKIGVDGDRNPNQLVLDGVGNVGIGTLAPAGLCHIHNSSAGEQFITSGNSALRFVSTGGANYIQSGTATSSSSAADLIFTNVGGTGETMRIDSSGNLLVGKTASSLSTDGVELGTRVESTTDGSYALRLNRKNSDGQIAQFRKDGSTVGSIGTGNSGNLWIGSGDTGINFNKDVNAVYPINADTGGSSNGAIDLGLAAFRYKDLYMEGTVNVQRSGVSGATTQLSMTGVGGTLNTSAGYHPLIVQSNGSEKARIDSSGNLLVGQTSNAETGTGIGLVSDGTSHMYSANTDALMLGRGGSDGEILSFNRSGTTVGSIGVGNSNDLTIGCADTGLVFQDNERIAPWNPSTNSLRDNAIDFGDVDRRFKDLYMSGTAYVGGLRTATSGTSNLRLGVNAGDAIVSGGNYNTVVGDEAGTAITTGDDNTFIGYASGDATTTAGGNTAVGSSAFSANTTGGDNVAIGEAALLSNTTASNNTAVGNNSLRANTTGAENAAFGSNAASAGTTGQKNTALGAYALRYDTQGSQSVAVGHQALAAQNFTSATSAYNVAVGANAGLSVTTGTNNTLIGGLAGDAITTGSNNTALGYVSLSANTTGANNVAIGKDALDSNTTASNNVAIGVDALQTNTVGAESVAIGTFALNAQNPSSAMSMYNVAVGHNSGAAVTTGTNNTLIGGLAGDAITTGGENVAVGQDALSSNTTGNSNTATGKSSLITNTTGAQNVADGGYALRYNTTGSQNTASGFQALQNNTTGNYNTAIGIGSGSSITTGSKNVILGSYNGNQGGLDIRTSSGHIVLSDGDGNPRGIFNNNGTFLVGTTDVTPGQNDTNVGTSITSAGRLMINNAGADNIMGRNTDGVLLSIRKAGEEKGSITVSSTATTYNTSSDERLKENIQDAEDAGSKIDAIKIRQFDWKSDGSHQDYGVIAQELIEVAPEAVHQPENTDDMMGVDYSKLVPTLIKEIQTLRNRVAQLEE